MDEEYQETVLDVVAEIAVGHVMTYGEVADAVAGLLRRGGPRQVGAVLRDMGGGVPWWRVVTAQGFPPAHLRSDALVRLRAEGCPLNAAGDRVALGAARQS